MALIHAILAATKPTNQGTNLFNCPTETKTTHRYHLWSAVIHDYALVPGTFDSTIYNRASSQHQCQAASLKISLLHTSNHCSHISFAFSHTFTLHVYLYTFIYQGKSFHTTFPCIHNIFVLLTVIFLFIKILLYIFWQQVLIHAFGVILPQAFT